MRSNGDKIIFKGNFPETRDNKKSIVVTHEIRDVSSVASYHSKNICYENYRILNVAGIGLYTVYTENINLNSVILEYDELSHGIVTNAADGVQFVGCKGKIEIIDSIFEGTVDDALNIHANYYHTVKSENNIIYAHRSTLSHGPSAYTGEFGVGDQIAVYNGRTIEEKDRFMVKDVKITGEWIIELTVDKDTCELYNEDLIENLSTNPKVYLKNTRFAKSNAHLRLLSRGNFVVENCDFTLPILLTGDTYYWFESSPVRDLTIKNRRFIGNRATISICPEFTPTKSVPFYHSGIKIMDNGFDCDFPLYAMYAKDIVFKNNQITGGAKPKLEFHDCLNLEEK